MVETPAKSGVLSTLLLDAESRTSQPASEIITELASARFDRDRFCTHGDWRNYVPAVVKDLWPALSDEARAAVFCTAMNGVDSELSD